MKQASLLALSTFYKEGFRTTYAANFVMNGGEIYVLSKLLGHKSVDITINNYAHLHPEHFQKSANVVNFGVSEESSTHLALCP